MNTNKKKVTAVVPARNCRRELAVCLAALCGGDCPPEIIVVDDASNDGTAQMVRKRWPSAVLLRLPVHTGFAHAANLGLRLVRTEYALLIRPQLQPGRSCAGKLLEALEPSPQTRAQAEQGPAAAEEIFCAVPRPAFNIGKSGSRAAIKNAAAEGFTLSENAARRAAPFGEIRVGDFSEGSQAPGTPRGTGTGMKNNASALFFTLSENAARRAAPFGEIRAGDFSEGSQVPGTPRGTGTGVKKNASALFFTLAVPDGCAMYRMKTLEEIGWLDERHFDGLEALDLSLRAALRGAWTVQVPGAHVRPVFAVGQGEPRNAYGLPMDTFRRQLAAGNGIYVLYKHLSALYGRPAFRLTAAAIQSAQRRSFERRGEKDAFRMAQIRGKALCSLERERRDALDHGVSVWAENLPDAAYLGMDKEAERVYPLFLAEKSPLTVTGFRGTPGMRALFRRSLPGILDQFTF